MGRWHAHAAIHGGGRVTAVVDTDRARAERLANRHPGCRTFAALSDALDVADVVHVCTPTASHVPLTEQALRAARHVLVEKPIASSAHETARMLGLANAAGVLICPVHQFPFQRGVERALARLTSIGSLRHIDMVIRSAGGRGLDNELLDRIAAEILPHPLSLLVQLLRDPVDALNWSIRRSGPGEFRALTQDRDVTVALHVSMSGRPTVNRLELVGTGGTIHVDLFHGFSATQRGPVSRIGKVTQPYSDAVTVIAATTANLVRRALMREPAYPGLSTLVRRFYCAAAGQGECPIGPTEILTIARACEQLCGLAFSVASNRATEQRVRI
jgi:predicted dehydrogenase